jgi:hypothetical protein
MKTEEKQAPGMEADLSVLVYDYQRKPLDAAEVKATDDEGKSTTMKFDAASGAYQATLRSPAHYTLSVSAKGYESQSRDTQLNPGTQEEVFFLGREGMEYYYRGRVKVPFEPLPGLIAVTTQRPLERKEADQFMGFAGELGLEGARQTPALEQENTWLFKGPADEEEQQRTLLQLTEHPLVRRAGPVITQEKDRILYLTPDLVVKFRPYVEREQVPNIAAEYGLEVIRVLPAAGNAFLLRAKRPPSSELLEICESLAAMEEVEYAEPNFAVTVEDSQINPTDFLAPEQWHIPIVELPDAWQSLNNVNVNRTFGDASVILAVMDRGIQSQTIGGNTTALHPDFQGALTSGADKVYRYYDFATMQPNNDNPPNDHGMGCAGVSSALANNPCAAAGVDEGVAGAAANCQVMGIIRPAGGTEVNYSDAFQWIAGFDPGWVADGVNYPFGTVFPAQLSPAADIVTNSFSWSPWPISGLMSDTIDRLTTYGRDGKGVLMFFASGNGNTQLTFQAGLAAHPKTFAIGASSLANDGLTETFATYSNFGQPLGSASGILDLCAPSHDTYVGGSALHNPPANYGVISADLVGQGNMPGCPAAQTSLSANAAAGATNLSVASTAGFAAGQALLIGNPGGAQTEATMVTAVASATQLNVTALLRGHNAGDAVQGAAANYRNNFGGTSSATPLAAGIAALVLSASPSLTWVEVRELLRDTADEIDAGNTNATNRWVDANGNNSASPAYAGPVYSRRYGYGRINAEEAVNAAIAYGFQRDIHIRDNLADNGLGPTAAPFWEGADIWVRNANDNIAPANYGIHANTVHQAPIAGQSNWVYVRFRNIGAAASYPFSVRVYLTHWAGTEFVYPDDYIPTVRPGDPLPSPLTPGTYLLGETGVNSLAALAEGRIAVEWEAALVPPATVNVGGVNVNWHPCLLAEITPQDGFTPTGTHVWQNNNLAQKNLSIFYPDPDGDDFAFAGVVGNLSNRSKFIGLKIAVEWPVTPKVPPYVCFLNRYVERYLLQEIERHGRDDLKPGQIEDVTVFYLTGKRAVKLQIPNVGLVPLIVGGSTHRLPDEGTTRIEVHQFDDSGWSSGGLTLEVRGKGA